MINKQIAVGIVEKPELKYTKTNQPFLKFTLKTWTRYDGQEYNEWVKCVLWGDRAQTVDLKDGEYAAVEGMQKTRSWEDENGKKQYMTECNVKVLETLSGVQEAKADGPEEDNLPF